MLAERATNGDWPEAINLPTASGKTACLDAAIFALAATAKAVVPERRMPRHIWFVVDRRIVVDEAYERAREIAKKLGDATEGPAKEIADRLRDLSGTGRPLAVARLRGGALRDDGWARLPSQPAIICSTVDQVGSALLVRGYGHSERTASIFAGLASQDSMILLDEAHCAVPANASSRGAIPQ
jgi:CRISPR-associated endonuclease/helicase Cas3